MTLLAAAIGKMARSVHGESRPERSAASIAPANAVAEDEATSGSV
jgi:hypothetical protein